MVERAVPPPKLRWRLVRHGEPVCEGEGEFTRAAVDVCLNELEPGPLTQGFSYDGGETFERALDWYWNGTILAPLPCRKWMLCTAPSGHKGPCR